ncbi:hypothetical protein [Oryzobacter terrae]|uniref:hypothetical protein n=1 Tax=Oryzobacter terrae TaxID=1620385 RepID=UPI00366E76B1
MEIIPGEGLPDVRVGASRADVVAEVGEPVKDGSVAWYHEAQPPFSVHYDADDVVEYVEVANGAGRGEEAELDGIRLTSRLLDDVLDDLRGAGYTGREVDIGFEYDAGFCVFSMSSLTLAEVDPTEPEDPEDERLVAEGVGIAPVSYWRSDG